MLAVILDVVDSRSHADQARLLRGVAAVTTRVLAEEGAARSAGPTTGDELQALYDDHRLGEAVRDIARLRLQLHLDPPGQRVVALRAGLGHGEVTDTSEAAAPGQSGTAWWAARDALDHAARSPRAWPDVSWWYNAGSDVEASDTAAAATGPGHAAVRATLVALDTLWGRFDDTDLVCARGLLDGVAANDLAEQLGVSRSTLSQRLHDHGVYGWVRTVQTLVEEDAT